MAELTPKQRLEEAEALAELYAHALPKDAPGAWIRDAIDTRLRVLQDAPPGGELRVALTFALAALLLAAAMYVSWPRDK